jgi:hypothetical protein
MDPETRRSLRYSSQGYQKDPPALFHPNILVGAGEMLTPAFVEYTVDGAIFMNGVSPRSALEISRPDDPIDYWR